MLSTLNIIVSTDIQDRIFASNIWMEKFRNMPWTNAATIIIPQYATPTSAVTIDQTTFDFNIWDTPTDANVTLTVHAFRLKPIKLSSLEILQVTYDLYTTVIKEKVSELLNQMSARALWNLATGVNSTRTIPTTGEYGVGNGADGLNKRKIQFSDLIKLKSIMDGDNLSQDASLQYGNFNLGPRWLLVDNVTYSEILGDKQIRKYMNFGVAVTESGTVDTILGMNVLQRSQLAYCHSSSGTSGYAGAAGTIITWNQTQPYILNSTPSIFPYGTGRVSLAFHGEIPVRVMSEPIVYANNGIAQVYGHIISAECYFTCANIRYDNKGVYTIWQSDSF